jgi:L-malate glycosyltransferase
MRFNILYAGTVDFSKLRSDFVDICKDILKQIPEATVTICGNGSSLKEVENQIKNLGLQNRITLEGLVSDLTPYFEVADVFLYPLDSKHYGTGEQVLAEAMVAGVVPVVFNNKAESEIVQDTKNGFICKDGFECTKIISLLNKDYTRLEELSNQARIDIQEKYSINKMITKWNNLFKEIMLLNKRERRWRYEVDGFYSNGASCFLESLGSEEAKPFIEYIEAARQLRCKLKSNKQWQSDSKGSINQYLEYFPHNAILKNFKKIMEE